ncbi:MAG: PQQ-binding-like beta-propeller repeat protein [Planctomycetes bacterium]|nr:PQQ-binding-like beta-propeller repeat protein [Planctomycetota bacterium]
MSFKRFSSILLTSTFAAIFAGPVFAEDWYQWRGPNRDGIATEKGLTDRWPEEGPPIVFQSKGLGSGMASVAIADGKICTIGNIAGNTHLICLKQSDGSILWKTPFTPDRGAANGTPTIDLETGFVYGLSFDGILVCCRLNDGEVVWKKSFPENFQGKMESVWGYSESPLIDGERLICTPGGKDAMVVCLNKKTGETIWSGKAPQGKLRGNDGAGYSSVVISNAAGRKQYVQLIGHGIVSYDAKTGALLWNYDRVANTTANIPTPIVKDDFVFCSTGYDDGGTALLQVSKSGNALGVKEVYYKSSKELQNHHGGMVMVGDYVYMGHGHNNGFPACVEWRTGKDQWEKGRGAGSGSAAILYADSKLFFRYQDGVMAMIDSDTKKYKLLGKFKLATHNGESWPHPVIVDGILYIRDQDDFIAYSLKK